MTKNVLPKASISRIFKNAGGERLSAEARYLILDDVESYATYIKGNEHKKWSADKFGEIVEATLYATLQPNSITTFIVGSKNIDF